MLARIFWAGTLLAAVLLTAGCKHRCGCCSPCCTPCCSPCTCCYPPGAMAGDPLLGAPHPITEQAPIQRVSLGVPVAP